MLKGYIKNIVVVQKPESRYCESAFFILRSGILQKTSETEILREAEKIVSSYLDKQNPSPVSFNRSSRSSRSRHRQTSDSYRQTSDNYRQTSANYRQTSDSYWQMPEKHHRQLFFHNRKDTLHTPIPWFDSLSFFLSGIACAGFTAGVIALTAYFIW